MYSGVCLARCSNLFHPSNILSMNSENLEMGIRCPGGVCTPVRRSGLNSTLLFFSFVESPSSERSHWSCFSRGRHIGCSHQRSLWIPTNDLTCLSFVGLIIIIQVCSEIMVMGVCFQNETRWILTVICASASVENAPLELPRGLGPRFLYHPKTEKEQRTHASCVKKK